MQKMGLILLSALAGAALCLALLWSGLVRSAQAQASVPPGSDEVLPAGTSLAPRFPAEPLVLPTPIPGETLVYFVPADSDSTATVLEIVNTDSVTHTATLRGYTYAGVLNYSITITIAADSFQRVLTDTLVASPPPSWATPLPLIANLTDFVSFASLSLPKGVKVDGYTLFDAATGTIDPRVDQGAIPLRFSADPASIFLPAVQ